MAQADLTGFGRHGGRLDHAAAAFPDAPRPWLDLSTGINPLAWTPPPALTFDPRPLPDVAALARLEATAAALFGVAAPAVVAVPGSELALRLLPLLGLPQPIVAVRPAYGTHGAIAARQVRIEELDAIAGTCTTLLLANPNNPDGRTLHRHYLRDLARQQRDAGGWLVVDEAFADADPQCSLVPERTDDAPVVILRSFGKFFGLAGVRLGFVIAPPPIAGRLRALLGDWPVGAQAIAWGTAAYADRAWIAGTCAALPAAAADLDALLARHGLIARGACPLFRLVETGRAGALFNQLARAGILTRPFADRPDWLRIGLPGSPAALDRFDRALADG